MLPGFVVVPALLAEVSLQPGTSAGLLDCIYANPKLHRYKERIDICLP